MSERRAGEADIGWRYDDETCVHAEPAQAGVMAAIYTMKQTCIPEKAEKLA